MMISDTENQPLSPNKHSSGNSGRNDLIIKLVFPPSSSIRSKFMFVQENQKVSDIVDYATQLAGLNPGYSLQLSASPTTGRPQWLDDDQLLISYSIPTSSEIKIKRKPGIKRRNTLSTIKPIKEGKVQKLTSITKIWTTRYLRLYSMRLAHSSNENDSSADHIQFADITNVDKEVNRKYTFVIYCQNTTTTSTSSTTTTTVGSGNAGLSQSQTVSSFQNLSTSTSGTNLFAESKKEKEYVFRCINQREAEDWITSIRSMLRSSRPDLLLPPLTPFLSVNNNNNNTKNTNNNNNNNNNTSNLILPPSPSPSNQLSLNNNNNSNNNNNIWTSPTLPSSMPSPTTTTTTTTPTISLNQSVTPINEKNTTIDREITPSQTPTKQRSLSFSFSKIGGNKRKELPPPFIQNQSSSTSSSPSSTSSTTPPLPPPTQSLSERNSQLEDEIKRLNEVLNRDTKSKVELEKKYQKIKAKMAILKKQRSRSLSTPATPEVPRKDKSSFIPTFLIGGSRVKDKDKDKDLQQQQQQQSQNATTTSSNTQISHKRHSSSSQSFNLNNINNGSSYSNNYKGIMMDDDNTDNDITSSEMFTGSVFDDADTSDFEKDKEIKDLKDQLVRIKEKIQLDLNEKTKVETSFKLLEKELFTQKKLDEKREREILVNDQRQDDQLDAMAELASRLKKTLFDLKEKLENEQQQQEDQDDEEDEENEYIDVEDGHDDDTNNNNISNINHDDSYQNENQYNINGKHNNSNNNNKEHIINNENEEDDEELDVDYGDIGDDIEDDDYDDKNESYIESGNITTASIKEDIDYQDLESTI
ncbi:hypothetical protein ACTFIR_002451 [Dictyostelium discoideum]